MRRLFLVLIALGATLMTVLNVSPGRHTLKLIMIDPEVVVEQIVVNPDNQRYSYFGAATM